MKPNGFVLAPSITSQMSMPIRSKIVLSSFTSATFTERKMFSRSFVDSATRELDTGTTRSKAEPCRSTAISVEAGSTPPTIFGMVLVVKARRPGSSRSGENASQKSCGHRRPLASRIGFTSSSVVPGYVVDSRTTS